MIVHTHVLRRRHLAKALSWRIIASCETMLLGWIFSGSLVVGASIGATEFFTKFALYYFHERAWYHFPFGVVKTEEDEGQKDGNQE